MDNLNKLNKEDLVKILSKNHPNDDLNSLSLRQLRKMEKDDFNVHIREEDEAERNQWNNLILNPQREDDITDYYAYRRTRTADPKEIERLNQEEANSLRLFKTHQEAKDNLKNPELSKAGNMLGSKRNFVLNLKNTAADIQNELRNEQQSQIVNGRMSEESAGQVVENTEVSPVQKHAPAQPAQPVQPAQPKSTPTAPQPNPTRYTPSVQSMNGIKVSKLPTHTDAYEERKTVTNQPSVETKTTQFGLPDAQTQEYIRKNIIEPTQKAYGVNPNTGDITPFQALGYNPEDERKRREAEMALNDRKRKENAWYNAFAVVGDALTAGLGGNVWKRQPNRIGQQAIADNQRLIAEQKAEDEGNAAKLRNAGTAYANTVNRLIQNYLSKTTTTNKTGGDRVETTTRPEQNGYKYVSNVERENNDGSGSGSGSRGKKVIKLAKKNQAGQVIGYKTMTVPTIAADAYSRLVSTTMQQKFENGELQGELDALRKAGIYDPSASDITKRWNADKLLTYGRSFYTDALNTEIEQLWKQADEYDGKPINWRDWDFATPAMQGGKGGWGTVPGAKTDSLDFTWK